MNNNYLSEKNLPNTTPILVMAILSLAIGGVVGIILGAIALSKVKAYLAAGGELAGTVKVAKTLATVGIILSIIYVAGCLVFLPFYFIFIFSMM